jgi:TPR repeat protein
MYLKGQGTQKDPEEARKWFRKAAKARHKGAQKALEAMEGGA